MTTITEILAEAFNRVKNEHGINLSNVEFEHYSGNLSGVTFTSSGIVRPTPTQFQTPLPIPEGATHYGSLDGGRPRFWKTDGALISRQSSWGWEPYVSYSDYSVSELIGQLTPL